MSAAAARADIEHLRLEVFFDPTPTSLCRSKISPQEPKIDAAQSTHCTGLKFFFDQVQGCKWMLRNWLSPTTAVAVGIAISTFAATPSVAQVAPAAQVKKSNFGHAKLRGTASRPSQKSISNDIDSMSEMPMFELRKTDEKGLQDTVEELHKNTPRRKKPNH
jgi:hypothetical protein